MLEGSAALALYLGLPFACVWAVPAKGRAAPVARFVYGLALYETLLLATGLVLGLGGQLRPRAYAATHALLLGALAVVGSRRSPDDGTNWIDVRRWSSTRRGLLAVALAGGVLLLFAIQLAADAWEGTRHVDALWYHIPRVLLWVWQGSLDPFPTSMWVQIGLPVGGNLVLGSKMLLGTGWAGASYVNALLTAGAVASVFLVALDAGLDRWRALLAAILFASFPAVGERVSSVSTDMAATFPVLAGYLAWTRARSAEKGAASFILLAGVGAACKPPIAVFVAFLGALAAHRSWKRESRPRLSWTIAAASIAALALVAASFWPVWKAFGSPFGGTEGATLTVHDVRSFARGVTVNAMNWALEPLGYLPSSHRSWMPELMRRLYGAVGVRFEADQLPFSATNWEPWPSPDCGRTGALALLAFPVVILSTPRRVRRVAVPLFLAAFVAISGPFYYQPYSGRFTITLLAGYALLWASATPFARPRTRLWFAVVVGINLAAALAVTSYLTLRDLRLSRSGGDFDFLSAEERRSVAAELRGAPLWLLSGTPRDALVPGPEVAFAFRYLICPPDGDWVSSFERAASSSPALALVPQEDDEVRGAAATFSSPLCPEIPVRAARAALEKAGWTRAIERPHVEVWLHARQK